MLGCLPSWAQKTIEYEAGMGRRDPANPDVWILSRQVMARHENMILYADSAHLDTRRNDVTAFGSVEIVLSDTTFIYGDYLVYDGTYRVVNIWDDTVRFIDGATELRTDHLAYDRGASRASYDRWGVAVNGVDTLESSRGYYFADAKQFYIFDDVQLRDTASWLETDTLLYNTESAKAEFVSPTYIYSDSTILYSETGHYLLRQQVAHSTRASRVLNRHRQLSCDTLHYNERSQTGLASGHVVILDTAAHLTCYGRHGFTDQRRRLSWVTDSALVVYVDSVDTLYVHADTLRVGNGDGERLDWLSASRGVRLFRGDVQAVCDSAYYSAADSLLTLYEQPVVWNEHYQVTSDTLRLRLAGRSVSQAMLLGNVLVAEQLDVLKFNQIKGNNAYVYFRDGEPHFADILGNAQMVYYITEQASDSSVAELIGVNVGVGSDMRIYFLRRQPDRVVTYGEPDMQTYPPAQLPVDKRYLAGFKWQDDRRPKSPADVMRDERE